LVGAGGDEVALGRALTVLDRQFPAAGAGDLDEGLIARIIQPGDDEEQQRSGSSVGQQLGQGVSLDASPMF